jgi:hypothetical protein
MKPRRNHKIKADISPKFLEEYKSRGFDMHVDSGGVFKKTYKNESIRKIRDKIFEINPVNERKMTFVNGKTFIKTIYQIESIVRYKLFK